MSFFTFVLSVVGLLGSGPAGGATADDAFARQREEMVARGIEARGVSDPAVLQAMRTVPRHRFVPDDYVGAAYADRPLPIGYGQTISQPYIVAFMTETLQVDEDSVVLEVGTGSGYQAAVLSPIVKRVYTIEIIEELARSAKERLAELGYDNVTVRADDGYFGWEAHAPYDGIIVTAAATHIPPALVEQLKANGRMVIPVGPPMLVQRLMLVEKEPDGTVRKRNLMPVRFVPLTGGR